MSTAKSRSEKHWETFVRTYNAEAKKRHAPLILRGNKEGASLSELFHGWLTEPEVLAMKADFFANILDSDGDLLERGFKRMKLERDFNKAGVQEAKKKGERTRGKVLRALCKIMAKRTSIPSNRELARCISAETKIPMETVREWLPPRKLLEDAIRELPPQEK